MINGDFSELKDYVGDGPFLLDFWTTWCPNCPKQMGYLSDIAEHFENNGLKVLGVNLNEPKIVNKVKPYIQNRNFSYDIAIDPENILGDYFGVNGIPTLILVDNDGNIINRYVGYSPGKEEEYIKDLENFEKKIFNYLNPKKLSSKIYKEFLYNEKPSYLNLKR